MRANGLANWANSWAAALPAVGSSGTAAEPDACSWSYRVTFDEVRA